MNYRHLYHAGNHADVLKHAAFAYVLAYLGLKPAAYAVLDTHAGIGRYDFTAPEAVRSPEWKDGIARLTDWPDAPGFLAPYLAAVAEAAPLYPGSPALALSLMRPQDRLALCELHPGDCATLRQTVRTDPRAQVHHRDGYEAVGALLPPPERRGVVLIDPPYEQPTELRSAADAAAQALRRFETGIVIWWLPLKDPAASAAAAGELRQQGRPVLRLDLAVATPQRLGKLTASTLLIANPPYGLEQAATEAIPALAERLAVGDGAYGRVVP